MGMRLEAKDRKYPTLTCVATVSSVRDEKLLIHFDGWGNEYDYLCEVDSTDIHPVGWAARHGHVLQKPKGTYSLHSFVTDLLQDHYLCCYSPQDTVETSSGTTTCLRMVL